MNRYYLQNILTIIIYTVPVYYKPKNFASLSYFDTWFVNNIEGVSDIDKDTIPNLYTK